MTRKCLRVTFTDDETGEPHPLDAIATSIQLVLPDEMGIAEARDYLVWKLSREIDNYVADECARHFYR